MDAALSHLSLPAILGGEPMFPDPLPLARPRVPEPDAVGRAVSECLRSGSLTNGELVLELEHRAAGYLGVARCVAVSSCTAGLMLLLRAAELTGDVILPSFTFAATAHAVAWNGLTPHFADIDPGTLTLSPESVGRAVGVRTSAVLATHIYGTPCDIEGLTAAARRDGVRLYFDAAHAFGSLHRGANVGTFGDAEVFSLSPTKPLVAAEGGIIATNDDVLAERCRIGRDYANPGDYDCRFVGLNARMSELHAAVALASFQDLEERIEIRNDLAARYRHALSSTTGIAFPRVPATDRSTFKDLTILVHEDRFGMDADSLQAALAAEGIDTRRYYSPPVHAMRAYRSVALGNGSLHETDMASREALSLPLWVGLHDDDIERVAFAIERIRQAPRGRRP
jgi:dTDP-4-amino-4,6-dideoxygalactose transaminase